MIKFISHRLQKFKCIIREFKHFCHCSPPCADVMSTRVLLKRGTKKGMIILFYGEYIVHLYCQWERRVIHTKIVYNIIIICLILLYVLRKYMFMALHIFRFILFFIPFCFPFRFPFRVLVTHRLNMDGANKSVG